MKGEDMEVTVNDIIKLLDKESNKYGGITKRERELNLSVNGDFVGTITSAKLDGWGDGLVTDVTLEVEVSRMKYHDEKVRSKAIDEFAERLKVKAEKILKNPDIAADCKKCTIWKVRDIDEIAEMLKAGGKNE